MSADNEKIVEEDVNRTLGYSGNKVLLELLTQIVKGDSKNAIDCLIRSYERGASPETIVNELLHLIYSLLNFQSTKVEETIYEEYNKEQIDFLIENTSLSILNQFWQILLKGREELQIAPQEIEALEVIVIRLSYSAKLPTIEQLVYSINRKKDNDLNINIDNNGIGNDIKKILDIFPGSKLINK